MEHEEEKGKLKEIKWQRGKGVVEEKARKRVAKGKEKRDLSKDTGKVLCYFN